MGERDGASRGSVKIRKIKTLTRSFQMLIDSSAKITGGFYKTVLFFCVFLNDIQCFSVTHTNITKVKMHGFYGK